MDISDNIYDFPYSCYINLTNKCNLRCKHCFGSYSDKCDKELSLPEWKKVVDYLVDNNIFFINISGGEPTQSGYFKEFISYLNYKGLHFILTTNGIFSREISKFIINNREYLIGVKISLDGPDEKSHCFIRRDSKGEYNKNIFKTTLKNIFYLKKAGIPITISTILHKENIKKMNKFQKLIQKINPVSWFISPIVPLGRGEENKEIFECYDYFNKNFWVNIYEKSVDNKINVKMIDVPFNINNKILPYYTCPAALNMCEINADGVVSPCTFARLCIPKTIIKFDNIRNKNLKEIWDGKPFNKFRSYMNKGCDGCKMINKCNKCVAQSFRYFNDGKSPSPYCIKHGKSLGLKNLNRYKIILKNNFGVKL
ncbi:MAG: radical SAM protein [archaeon]|nr:radical SAM protein [archaeon]